jgi:hypothetical protein
VQSSANVRNCIVSCGVAASLAVKVVDDFADSPCIGETLRLQKQETAVCKSLGR